MAPCEPCDPCKPAKEGFTLYTGKIMFPVLLCFFYSLIFISLIYYALTMYDTIMNLTTPTESMPTTNATTEIPYEDRRHVIYSAGEYLKFIEKISQLCNSHYRRLPNPNPQIQINSTTKADCEFVFFGFVDDGTIFHRSLANDLAWVTSNTDIKGRLPFRYKECYEVQLPEHGIPTVVAVENCEGIVEKSLLFLTNDYTACRKDRFKCVDVFNAVPKKIKFKNRMPHGKVHSSESLQMMLENSAIVIVSLKSSYLFKYRHLSSRFIVVDPEYECVVFDTDKNKIVTRNCEDRDCSICTIRIT